MPELPILEPEWKPDSEIEAGEALELARQLFERASDYLDGGARQAWLAFLYGHPELKGEEFPREQPDGSVEIHYWYSDTGRPLPYETILAALRELAPAQPEGATSWDLCLHLWGPDARRDESNQIGQRLFAMTKADHYDAPHAVRRASKGHYLPLEYSTA